MYQYIIALQTFSTGKVGYVSPLEGGISGWDRNVVQQLFNVVCIRYISVMSFLGLKLLRFSHSVVNIWHF